MRATKTETRVRQEQIAQAAFAVVERHGLRGLNVARVAALVGVVPSGLYRHCGGKDDVLETVLDAIADRLAANVARARAAGGNALDRLHSLLALHLTMVRSQSAIPRVVFSDELLHGRPTLRRRMHTMVSSFVSQVETLVREGQLEGNLRVGPPPEAVAMLFVGLIQPAVLLWTMSAGEMDLDAHAETIWPLFVQAIGTLPPPPNSSSPPPTPRCP